MSNTFVYVSIHYRSCNVTQASIQWYVKLLTIKSRKFTDTYVLSWSLHLSAASQHTDVFQPQSKVLPKISPFLSVCEGKSVGTCCFLKSSEKRARWLIGCVLMRKWLQGEHLVADNMKKHYLLSAHLVGRKSTIVSKHHFSFSLCLRNEDLWIVLTFACSKSPASWGWKVCLSVKFPLCSFLLLWVVQQTR